MSRIFEADQSPLPRMRTTRKQLEIERRLERSTAEAPLFARYEVIRANLAPVYSYWAAGFPGGNDHGWTHIERVLARLDGIVKSAPKQVSDYEVFLAMIATLFHDWAIVQGRKGHPEMGAHLLKIEHERSELSEVEIAIVSAAVASHGGKTDIEVQTALLSASMVVHDQNVRPRVVAALVRLADELDEDDRRAPERAIWLTKTPGSSLFYWRFSQNISGIETKARAIDIHVRFRPEDLEGQFEVDGKWRIFLAAFAEKIAKINAERMLVNRFLPGPLQFDRLLLKVTVADRPHGMPNTRTKLTAAKEFSFGDVTTAIDLLNALGDLWKPALGGLLNHALELAKDGKYDEAREKLSLLERVIDDLPPGIALGVLYDQACFASRQASAVASTNRKARVAEALRYLKRWHALGSSGAWVEGGRSESAELQRMGRDDDLAYLVFSERDHLTKALPQAADRLPPIKVKASYGQGSACVALGNAVSVGGRVTAIELLREDDVIDTFDASTTGVVRPGTSTVRRIGSHRGVRAIRLNGSVTLSPTQPILAANGAWVTADQLESGNELLSISGDVVRLTSVEQLAGRVEFFDLSVRDDPHTFAVGSFICHNKYPFMLELDQFP